MTESQWPEYADPAPMLECMSRRGASERKFRLFSAACARRVWPVMSGDHVRLALDARGQSLTSETLAQRLTRWRDNGRGGAYFLIGGADGLAGELKRGADLVLAFGSATWPHQLVRIMLLEQLYRVATMLSGHPYHRA